MARALVYLSDQLELQRVIESFKKSKNSDNDDIKLTIAISEVDFLEKTKDTYEYYVIDNEELLPILKEKEGFTLIRSSNGKQFNQSENIHRFKSVTDLTRWLIDIQVFSMKSQVNKHKEKGEEQKEKKITHNIFDVSQTENRKTKNSPPKDSTKNPVLESHSKEASVKNDEVAKKPLSPTERTEVKEEKTTPIVENHREEDVIEDLTLPTEDMLINSSLNQKEEVPSKIVVDENELKYAIRAKEIQKRMVHGVSWEDNKTIGIWSPLYRMGVTTFIFNYALFLGNQKIQCAVMEGLNEQRFLKTLLKRYNSIPEGWTSYASTLHDTSLNTDSIRWEYHNVSWFPLDDNDISLPWDYESLYHYFHNVKYFDTVLVDLPTGKMEDYTLYTLEHLDELWIIVDDSFHQIVAWKRYIENLKKKHDIPFYLIFNKEQSFSQKERLSDELGIPLLISLPSLFEEVMRNAYERKPLLDQPPILEKLEKPFTVISKHLISDDFCYKPPRYSLFLRTFQQIRNALQRKTKRDMI